MTKETRDKRKKKDDEEEISKPPPQASSLKQMLVQEGSMYSMRQGSRRSVSTQRSVNSVGSVISNGTRRSIKSDDITPRVTNRTIKTIGTKGLEANKLRSIILADQKKAAKLPNSGDTKKHKKVKKKKPRDLDSDDQNLSTDDHTVGESSIGTESYDQLSGDDLTDASSITSKKKIKKNKKKPPRHGIVSSRSEDYSDDNTEGEHHDDDDMTEASSVVSKKKSRKKSPGVETNSNDDTQEDEHTDTDNDTTDETDEHSRLGGANLGLLLPALPDFDRKMVRTIDIECDDRPNTVKRKISAVRHGAVNATKDDDICHVISELNIPVIIDGNQNGDDLKSSTTRHEKKTNALDDNDDDLNGHEEEQQSLASNADQVDDEEHLSDFHQNLFNLVSQNEDQFKVFLEALLPGRDISSFHEFCDTVAEAVTEKSSRRNGGQAMQDDDMVPELPNLSTGADGSPTSPKLPFLIDDDLDSLASAKSSKGLSSRGLMMNRQGSTLRMENFHRRSLIRQEAARRRSRISTIISHRPQNGGSISNADYLSFFEEHIAELERLLDDQENEIDQLDRVIMKYKKNVHELTDEFEAKKRSTVYLEDKCTLLKAELSKAISRADSLQLKISENDADRELKYLEVCHERDELAKELSSLRKENSEIRFAFSEIQETLGPKDDRLSLLMGEMDVLKYNIIQAKKETAVAERRMSFGSDADFDPNMMSIPSSSKSNRRSLKESMGGSERRLSSGGTESRERRLSMTSPSRGIGRTVSERIHMPVPSFNLPDPRHHSAGIEKLPAYRSRSQSVKRSSNPAVSLTPTTVAGHPWEDEVAKTVYKVKDNLHPHNGSGQEISSAYLNGRQVNNWQGEGHSGAERSMVRTDPSPASLPTALMENAMTPGPRVMIDLSAATIHAETLAESVAASSEASSGKKKKKKEKSERKERKRDKKEHRHRSDQSVVGVDAD